MNDEPRLAVALAAPAALLLVLGCARPERYGFVAVLGNEHDLGRTGHAGPPIASSATPSDARQP